jgi:hypothetical protein
MINDNKTVWGCIICQQPTGTLHEIFFGTWKREKSIKYNLQVPCCPKHHAMFHGTERRLNLYENSVLTEEGRVPDGGAKWQQVLCYRMGFPHMDIINQALNQGDNDYLDLVAAIGELKLKQLEVIN